MSKHVRSYWTEAPPSGIVEGLVASGLLSKSQKFEVKQSTQIQYSNNRKPMVLTPMKAAIQNRHIHSRHSACAINHIKTKKNIPGASTLNDLLPGYKTYTIEEIAKNGIRPKLDLQAPDIRIPKSSESITVTRKDGKSLSQNLQSLISEIDESLYQEDTSDGFYCSQQKLLNVHLMIWNDLTIAIKSFNCDFALVSNKIKNFIQNYIKNVPEMINKYKRDIEEKCMDYNFIASHLLEVQTLNNSLNDQLEVLNDEIVQLKSKIESDLTEYEKLKQEHEHALYTIDTMNAQMEDQLFKYGKLEEVKESLKATVAQKDNIIEQQNKDIADKDERIARFEEEGAGFRPLYNKAKAELTELQSKINSLRSRSHLVDVQTEPISDPNSDSSIDLNQKQNQNQNLNLSTTEKNVAIKKRRQTSSIFEEINTKEKPIEIKASISDVFSKQPQIMPEWFNNIENSASFAYMPRIKLAKVETTAEDEIPAGGHRSIEEFSIPPSHASFVNRLYPAEMDVQEPNCLMLNDGTSKSQTIKSFGWTLRQVVGMFHNGFEFDLLSSIKTFKEIIFKSLEASSTSPKVLARLQQDFMRSVNTHRAKSDLIELFTMFAAGDFSLTDFRFFNILFNIVYDFVTPAFDDILKKMDSESERGVFLIHVDIVSHVFERLLNFDLDHAEENIREGLQKGRSKEYPNCISFKVFSEAAITVFKESREHFHQQIRTILGLTGWQLGENISQIRYTEFMRFIRPFGSESDFKANWNRLLIFAAEEKRRSISMGTLLRLFRDTPDLSRDIFALPKFKGNKITPSTEAMLRITTFMHRRYLDVVPRLYESLSVQRRLLLKQYITKMRDAIIRGDISTSITYYKYILVTIDIKSTEDAPYVSFTPYATMQDVRVMTNLIMMRECLASRNLGEFKENGTLEEVISESREIIKEETTES